MEGKQERRRENEDESGKKEEEEKHEELPVMALNHVSRLCRSVKDSMEFYTKVLGFVVIERPHAFESFDGAWLFNYGVGIHLVECNDEDRLPSDKKPLDPIDNHISFQCEDMEAIEERLKVFNIKYIKRTVEDEENKTAIDQLFFDDPDGFMIEMCNCENLKLVPAGSLGNIKLPMDQLAKLSELDMLDLSNNGGSLANSQLDLKLQNPGLEKLLENLTHIQQLYLDNVDLSSNVPNIVTKLTSLKALSLPYCNLYGELPKSIFALPKLEILYLSGNRDLTGVLPQFQLNSSLKELYLFGTSFSGEVPPSIENLAHLEKLDLCGCYFSGSLPSSLANMTTLTVLLLSNNNFRGQVPFSITKLTKLEAVDFSNLQVSPKELFPQLSMLPNLSYLRLAEMNLATEIPSFIANFTKLTYLDLAASQLTGTFPDWFANLTQLKQLYLENNHLEGPIPHWFSQFTNLQSLELSYNNLFGNIDMFFQLPNLQNLALSGVNLTLPADSSTNSSLLKLELLELASCNLTEFPKFLQHQNELQSLSLKGNNIKGSIPQWLVNITKEGILILDLSENKLTGFEQFTVGLPWTQLVEFHFRGNKLRGILPSPPNTMKFYDVSNNLLSGVIPEQICNARSLISLDLSGNNITGKIPDCVGNELGHLPTKYFQNWQAMKVSKEDQSTSYKTLITFYFKLGTDLDISEQNFEYSITITNKGSEILYPKILTVFRVIDLSSNNFSGTIPHMIGGLKGLQALNLSNNKLKGRIPPSLANIMDLESLDLSHNKLSGKVPQALSQLTSLEVFNISHNHHLMGPVPEGNQFDTFDDTSYQGNSELCGNLLSKKCKIVDDVAHSSSPEKDDENKDSDFIDWVVRSLGCISGTIVGFAIGKIYITDKYHEWFMETFGRRRPIRRVRRA
ncbi:Receptor-like protein Cf-9-like protein [Bienertia sinuspersici]